MIRRLVILLVGLWLIAELVAVPMAGRLIASQVAARTRNATTVHASIGTFPVIARAVFLQQIKSVTVTLDRVTGERVPFSEIRFDVKGVGIDRASLLKGKPRVTSIDSGTVTATINLADISPVTGRLEQNVHMEGRTLMLGPIGVAIRSDLIPCSPQPRVEGSNVILTCSFADVPPVLIQRAQR